MKIKPGSRINNKTPEVNARRIFIPRNVILSIEFLGWYNLSTEI